MVFHGTGLCFEPLRRAIPLAVFALARLSSSIHHAIMINAGATDRAPAPSFLHREKKRATPVLLTVACALLASGCAPRFHYAPRHDAAYAPLTPKPDLQIERGDAARFARLEDAIAWSRTDEQIIAHALADELKHAELFRAVKVVDRAGPARGQDKYFHAVHFDIRKFGVRPQDNLVQKAGRAALKYLGPRGYFANKGIPRQWVAEAEIEFAWRDGPDGGRTFSKVYRATPRSVSASGYSGREKQERALSQALEEVVKAFVRDLAGQTGAQKSNECQPKNEREVQGEGEPSPALRAPSPPPRGRGPGCTAIETR